MCRPFHFLVYIVAPFTDQTRHQREEKSKVLLTEEFGHSRQWEHHRLLLCSNILGNDNILEILQHYRLESRDYLKKLDMNTTRLWLKFTHPVIQIYCCVFAPPWTCFFHDFHVRFFCD